MFDSEKGNEEKMDMTECEQELKKLLDAERWREHTLGQIDGALVVLEILKVPMEDRARILADAVGLSMATANDLIEDYRKQKQ